MLHTGSGISTPIAKVYKATDMVKKVASAKGVVASEESEVGVKSPSASLRTRSKKGAAGDAALNTLNVDIGFTCSIESCSNPYLEPCT